MEAVLPWKTLIDLIAHQNPKTNSKGGRTAYPLAIMLRAPSCSGGTPLSDPAMANTLIEVPIRRRLKGIRGMA